MQIFAENRRFSQIHPFSWKFQHLEGAGNRRKPQIFAENRRFSQKTAGNRRLGSVTLGPSPLARPFFPFWDFPDFLGFSRFARGWSGDYPDLSLSIGLLRAPTRNSPERVHDTIWTFPEKKWETPRFRNPPV